jgi:hypothetical protein
MIEKTPMTESLNRRASPPLRASPRALIDVLLTALFGLGLALGAVWVAIEIQSHFPEGDLRTLLFGSSLALSLFTSSIAGLTVSFELTRHFSGRF